MDFAEHGMKIASQSPLYTRAAHAPRESDRETGSKHRGDPAAPAAERPIYARARLACPAWLKQATFRDDTAVAARDGQWTADHPAHGFGDSLHRHLALRWMHDSAVASDQIGPATHAATRRRQLRAIPDAGYLAEQYGLRTVKNHVPLHPRHPRQDMPHGLRIAHDLSAEYQRDAPHPGLRQQCLGIYQGLGHAHPADRVLFVNSKTNASRILARLRHDHLKSASKTLDRWKIASGLKKVAAGKVRPLRPGLVAIEFKSGADAAKAEEMLKLLGGRPSIHAVNKLAHQAANPGPAPSRLEPGLDNRKALLELLSEDGKEVISALQRLPDGHAMRSTANAAVSVLAGLRTALAGKADSPEFRHDPLIANAFGALTDLARALPALTEDSARFFPAYAALLEELHLLLASSKPYEDADFKQAASAMLKARAGPVLEALHIAEPETYLVSSGMEAISMGIDAARKLSGAKRTQPLAQQEKLPDYFESLDLRSEGRKWLDKDRIRIAPLNPSRPWMKEDDSANSWDAEKLIGRMEAWLGAGKMDAGSPAVLVLDTTIEQRKPEGRSDLEAVLTRLRPHIDSGRLKIVLCKSYQKYTSLGSAKIMAGGVTVIARDDAKTRAAAAKLRKAERDLGWMGNDESQLLTHFMTHAHASELETIGEAARNAAFIDKFCFDAARRSGKIDVRREEGLPFMIIGDGALHEGKRRLSRQLEYRDSFGFLASSMLDVTDEGAGLRITAGRETREELVEKLYGFGWMHETGLKQFTPADVAKEVERLAADAVEAVLRESGEGPRAPATPGEPGRPAENRLTGQLRMLGRAFAPRLADGAIRGGDVNAMRMAIRRGPAGLAGSLESSRYASNAVASLLAMCGMAFDPEDMADDARQALESLYDAVLGAGLPGVSPATRAHIVLDWSRLRIRKLGSPDADAQGAAVNELVRHVRLSSYRETGAKVFAGIPDRTFARLGSSEQRQLADAMFAPLDAESRRLFIRALKRGNEAAKLGACMEILEEDRQAAEGRI
ncbi:hypothetical protein [Pseudoduganella namucuonensis]|uniref:Uncharacterized protein n=1 Tax=Pseudoduganella namucuonensis TaxID=1035707 RepID=A0A1I7L7H6_9BURK|nr:hypothetical protein [Pseudoduganella namucuonensis]SFV05653.1 hypothetical protein SAMN05216552_102463 [Pseudoduganella namucuonensis]